MEEESIYAENTRLDVQIGHENSDIAQARRVGRRNNLPKRPRVSVNFIGYVERGERSVSIKTLEQIAVALNVMPRNLFEFSEGDIDELTFEAHLNEARSLTQGDLRVLTNLAARLNRHQVMNAAKSASH